MTDTLNTTPRVNDDNRPLMSKETAKVLGKRLALALAVAIPVAIITAVIKTTVEVKTAQFLLDNEE